MKRIKQHGSGLLEFLIGLLLMLLLWAAADLVVDALRAHQNSHIETIAKPNP